MWPWGVRRAGSSDARGCVTVTATFLPFTPDSDVLEVAAKDDGGWARDPGAAASCRTPHSAPVHAMPPRT